MAFTDFWKGRHGIQKFTATACVGSCIGSCEVIVAWMEALAKNKLQGQFVQAEE
jgi:hypothetical protein